MTPPRERWFLLRGMVREAAHWGDFPARLRGRLPDVEVHTLEVPGNGRAFQKASPLTIAGMVQEMRAEMDDIVGRAPGAPNYFLAVSLGAMIAVDWIFRHPHDLSGAVLVNTSLSGLNPLHQRLSPSAYLPMLRLFAERDAARRERHILGLTANLLSPEAIEAAVRARAEIYEKRPISRVNALRQLAAATRYRVPRGKPTIPLLVLGARGDRMVSPACSETIARAWNVPYQGHPTAGHDLPLDDPEWLLDALANWRKTL